MAPPGGAAVGPCGTPGRGGNYMRATDMCSTPGRHAGSAAALAPAPHPTAQRAPTPGAACRALSSGPPAAYARAPSASYRSNSVGAGSARGEPLAQVAPSYSPPIEHRQPTAQVVPGWGPGPHSCQGVQQQPSYVPEVPVEVMRGRTPSAAPLSYVAPPQARTFKSGTQPMLSVNNRGTGSQSSQGSLPPATERIHHAVSQLQYGAAPIVQTVPPAAAVVTASRMTSTATVRLQAPTTTASGYASVPAQPPSKALPHLHGFGPAGIHPQINHRNSHPTTKSIYDEHDVKRLIHEAISAKDEADRHKEGHRARRESLVVSNRNRQLEADNAHLRQEVERLERLHKDVQEQLQAKTAMAADQDRAKEREIHRLVAQAETDKQRLEAELREAQMNAEATRPDPQLQERLSQLEQENAALREKLDRAEARRRQAETDAERRCETESGNWFSKLEQVNREYNAERKAWQKEVQEQRHMIDSLNKQLHEETQGGLDPATMWEGGEQARENAGLRLELGKTKCELELALDKLREYQGAQSSKNNRDGGRYAQQQASGQGGA
eukprot:TRINITY_DN13885_c0_g1_i1.p1 TRINITY_DN13885_c0_g1~~TRINITY_DN13885_c0_g1_i1.p1  ORF type:complete len:614 (-),score=103.47 TRINITY_DN13885_c0_g1_i1:163-1824(-)